MGLISELLSSVTGTLSEVDGDGKGGGTRGDMDWSSTGEVETSLDERPTVGVPGHTCQWVVDDGRPDEREQEGRTKATAFGHRTNRNDRAERNQCQIG